MVKRLIKTDKVFNNHSFLMVQSYIYWPNILALPLPYLINSFPHPVGSAFILSWIQLKRQAGSNPNLDYKSKWLLKNLVSLAQIFTSQLEVLENLQISGGIKIPSKLWSNFENCSELLKSHEKATEKPLKSHWKAIEKPLKSHW